MSARPRPVEIDRVTVCLFAKPPTAGAAKTRLAPAVGEAGAAALAAAFVEDSWAALGALPWADPVLATTEVDDALARLAAGRPPWLQGPGDLGARLERVLGRALAAGRPALALGADTPGLPPRLLEQARAALRDHDAALGPADDGGFYLLGLTRCPPGLLADLPWSESGTGQATLDRLRARGLTVARLDPWFDLDRPEDLVRFSTLLERGEVCAPATRRLLAARARGGGG
jgi:hypothetical protein